MTTQILGQRLHVNMDRVVEWFVKADLPLRAYAVGMCLLAVTVVTVWLSAARGLVSGLFVIAGSSLATGFVLEAYALGLRLWQTRPGKLIGALVATLVAAIAMGLASVCVNEATGLDPSHFPYAVAFLAPWTAGYILLLATVVVSLLAMLAFAIYSLLLWIPAFTPQRKAEKQHFANWILFRMLGWISLVLMTSVTWESGHRRYESALTGAAGLFTFILEMYGQDACARKGERVRRIADDLVAIGTLTGGRLQVELRSCPLAPGPTTAARTKASAD